MHYLSLPIQRLRSSLLPGSQPYPSTGWNHHYYLAHSLIHLHAEIITTTWITALSIYRLRSLLLPGSQPYPSTGWDHCYYLVHSLIHVQAEIIATTRLTVLPIYRLRSSLLPGSQPYPCTGWNHHYCLAHSLIHVQAEIMLLPGSQPYPCTGWDHRYYLAHSLIHVQAEIITTTWLTVLPIYRLRSSLLPGSQPYPCTGWDHHYYLAHNCPSCDSVQWCSLSLSSSFECTCGNFLTRLCTAVWNELVITVHSIPLWIAWAKCPFPHNKWTTAHCSCSKGTVGPLQTLRVPGVWGSQILR
jgi:hypothetical protein